VTVDAAAGEPIADAPESLAEAKPARRTRKAATVGEPVAAEEPKVGDEAASDGKTPAKRIRAVKPKQKSAEKATAGAKGSA